MATKIIDEKVYNDLLHRVTICDEAIDNIQALIDGNTSAMNLYRDMGLSNLAAELALRNNGLKTALNCIKETNGEFYKSKGLINKIELFRETIEHELLLKRDTISVYSQIENNDEFVNDMKHEYIGMNFARELFEKIIRGDK